MESGLYTHPEQLLAQDVWVPRPCPKTFGDKPALGVFWGPSDVYPSPPDLTRGFVFLEGLLLVIRNKIDRVYREPNDEKPVVGSLKGNVRLFRGLVDGKCNNEQSHVLNDCC